MSIWKAVNKFLKNAGKNVRTEENVIRNVAENCKNAYFEKILKNEKISFKCNFEENKLG